MHVRRLNAFASAAWLASLACTAFVLGGCSGEVDAKDAEIETDAVDLALPLEWRGMDGASTRVESEASLDRERNGRVILWRASGAKSAEGELVNGKKQGEWSFWREDGGLRWQGSFLDDVAHGTERAWHPGGQLWFEGERVEGKREGVYRYWYENGSLELEAEFHDDVRDGPCKRFTLDGALDPEQSGRYERGRKL